MNSTPVPVPVPAGTVVVGLDGSVSAGQALGWAIDQAVAEHRPLTLVHAVTPPDVFPDEGRRVLGEARAEVERRAPGAEVHEVLAAADPRVVLTALSREASTVVLGSRGRGPVRSLLLGSVGVGVSRHASCPVVVHRPGNQGLVRHGVLVGVDGAAGSVAVLEHAFRQASLRRLPLTVAHLTWASEVEEDDRLVLAEALAGMGEKYPDVTVTREVTPGRPVDVLVERGERMNLLVVGTHHGWLAASVVEHATCPVAVVPL